MEAMVATTSYQHSPLLLLSTWPWGWCKVLYVINNMLLAWLITPPLPLATLNTILGICHEFILHFTFNIWHKN